MSIIANERFAVAVTKYPFGLLLVNIAMPKSEIVRGTTRLQDRYLLIPDAPCIGVELAENAQQLHP